MSKVMSAISNLFKPNIFENEAHVRHDLHTNRTAYMVYNFSPKMKGVSRSHAVISESVPWARAA